MNRKFFLIACVLALLAWLLARLERHDNGPGFVEWQCRPISKYGYFLWDARPSWQRISYGWHIGFDDGVLYISAGRALIAF